VTRRAALRAAAILAALASAGALPAEAHLVQSGLGPFYDGVSHFAVSADDLLGALAVALLGGVGGPRAGRWALFSLAGAWLAGGIAGIPRETVASWPLATALSLIVVGALVAWNPRLPAPAVGALAVAVGALHGYLNGSLSAGGSFGFRGLLGTAASAFVVVALAAALAVSLKREWTRIAVRVAGSWIAAIGLLMAAWSLR
jgi:hydrogenase/urease accessory protein HupE